MMVSPVAKALLGLDNTILKARLQPLQLQRDLLHTLLETLCAIASGSTVLPSLQLLYQATCIAACPDAEATPAKAGTAASALHRAGATPEGATPGLVPITPETPCGGASAAAGTPGPDATSGLQLPVGIQAWLWDPIEAALWSRLLLRCFAAWLAWLEGQQQGCGQATPGPQDQQQQHGAPGTCEEDEAKLSTQYFSLALHLMNSLSMSNAQLCPQAHGLPPEQEQPQPQPGAGQRTSSPGPADAPSGASRAAVSRGWWCLAGALGQAAELVAKAFAHLALAATGQEPKLKPIAAQVHSTWVVTASLQLLLIDKAGPFLHLSVPEWGVAVGDGRAVPAGQGLVAECRTGSGQIDRGRPELPDEERSVWGVLLQHWMRMLLHFGHLSMDVDWLRGISALATSAGLSLQQGGHRTYWLRYARHSTWLFQC